MVQRQGRRTGSSWSQGSDEASLADLLAAAAAGDEVATEAVIERHSRLVWSIVWGYRLSRADASDVTQIVWMRLVENIGRIRQPSSLGAWLGAVTRHECHRLHKRGEREVVASADEFFQPSAFGDDVDVDLLRRERDAAVREAFECLPTRWRALLEAFIDAPSATYEELSAVVGMPIGSIGPTRQRCLERLREAPALVELNAA